ncbi:pilus (MSHA type) biogenesis protein MshL [uncultured Ferrimonas sp.]|uniref:pilus (MSHA type) biogenesis protein MshL n=1 Tax=uncultured Ferrimonas sp. TaxID=432640 RepID=UPI002603FCF8|nr:pilus (MSHA type) biogenesis protein MshL [uncultured Ferrimonas sp.]
MERLIKGCLSAAVILGLSGCQNLPADHVEPTHSLTALDQAVDSSQQTKVAPPPLPLSVQQQIQRNSLAPVAVKEPLIDVAANGVDAKAFFASLTANSRYNVAVHPAVNGTISMNLRRVSLRQVMQTVQDLYGYDVRISDNVIQVFPAGLRSETIPVNYLLMQRNGLSLTSVNSGRISDEDDSGSSSSDSDSSSDSADSNSDNGSDSSNGTFISTRTDTDFWTQLELVLQQMVGNGPGRKVIVLPQAGLVTVKAAPSELRQVKDFLEQAGSNLTRQVVLEARILEVRLNDGYQQGINWSNVEASMGNAGNVGIVGGTSGGVFGDMISGTLGGVTSLTFSGADFEAVVSLLDTQGDVDTLSSPRVTAINNQKAVIKVGKDEYFVTGFSTTTVASTTPVTNPEVELTPFFSGIALDVTPQISAEGDVLLHVHPSVTEITEQTKVIETNDSELSLPLAQSDIRESDTLVRARSGDVVVIGGLMQTSNTQMESKIPLLGDIPGLGELFTNRAQQSVKTELVILLRPTVVEKGTWSEQLRQSRSTVTGWY